MTALKYTKSENEFLLTGYTEGGGDKTTLSFSLKTDGILYIGNMVCKVSEGTAVIRNLDIGDGVYAPILKINDGSYICDKIKSEAGTLSPEKNEIEQLFRLTKRAVSAEERLSLIEARLSRLCDAVYGEKIF